MRKNNCVCVYNADVMFYLLQKGYQLEGVCKNYKVPNATVFFFVESEALQEDIGRAKRELGLFTR